MKINDLMNIDVARSKRWHPNGGLESWTALEWAGAMCGEAGEAANAAKKLKRVEDELSNLSADATRHLDTAEKAQRYVMRECADTILYALLLMARCGCTDAEEVIRGVFNAKSVEYGFPERL